jgi:hypothetical protein
MAALYALKGNQGRWRAIFLKKLTEKPGLYLDEMAVFLQDDFGITV